MLLSRVGASPWNKMSGPTCVLCACSMTFLFGEASGIAIILTARLWMADYISMIKDEINWLSTNHDDDYDDYADGDDDEEYVYD